ncbi:MAG: type II toxin-antitoxin system VapC family toxin [Cyanobacteriota bacterium]|nr:type II toxin-antitoxin system VapC family toxin [Cyanobacteriota bacterium]
MLLDTNALAMVLTDDPRLPRKARQRIGDADRAALSVISLCEISQNVRLGPWPDLVPFAPAQLDRADADGFDLLPLSPSTALAAALLDWDHRDPFDRMIAGVSRQEELLLISADAAFRFPRAREALGLSWSPFRSCQEWVRAA